MNAVNAVLLLILVWTFTAVCQADDVISVICEDVTGTVGEEVNLTCSVSLSQECSGSCITLYTLYYPEGDSVICKEFPEGSCEQRNSFTCRFTPTTAMTGQFRFFVQTYCGEKSSEFTVSITEPSTLETVTKDSHMKEYEYEDHDHGFMARIITGACVSGFFVIIIIVIIAIVCVRRFRRNNPSGVQMKYERGASAEPTITTVNCI